MNPDPQFVDDEEEARIAAIINGGTRRPTEPWQEAIGDAVRVLVDENKRLREAYEQLEGTIRGSMAIFTSRMEAAYERGWRDAIGAEHGVDPSESGAQSDSRSRSSAVPRSEQSDEQASALPTPEADTHA